MSIEDQERELLRKKKISVAVLFIAAIAVAGVFAWWMGAFGVGPSRHLHVRYGFAGGIDHGSPVRLAGIKVGRVSRVEFQPQDDGTMLTLRLELSRSAFDQLTDASKFYVNLAGLIGERYVEIVTQPGNSLKPGQTLRGIDPPRVDQLLSQGYGIFGDLRELLEDNKGDIKELMSSLNHLASAMNDLVGKASPEDRKRVSRFLEDIGGLATELRQLARTLNQGAKYMGERDAAENWDRLTELLNRAERTSWNDIRRLLLEDGVKVNFSSKGVEDKSK